MCIYEPQSDAFHRGNPHWLESFWFWIHLHCSSCCQCRSDTTHTLANAMVATPKTSENFHSFNTGTHMCNIFVFLNQHHCSILCTYDARIWTLETTLHQHIHTPLILSNSSSREARTRFNLCMQWQQFREIQMMNCQHMRPQQCMWMRWIANFA